MLSYTGKKIIQSRLLDKNIMVNITDLDTILINQDNFNNLNDMYNFIVDNYNQLIIL